MMAKTNAKTLRKEVAKKKAKQKKLLIICICVLVVAAAAAVAIFFIAQPSDGEVYRGGGQLVQFLEDGSFSATLPHGVRKSGTYTKTVEDGRTIVAFNTDGIVVTGYIEDDMLHLPHEWDDGHGHDIILPKG